MKPLKIKEIQKRNIAKRLLIKKLKCRNGEKELILKGKLLLIEDQWKKEE